jgi:hypothetical protein
MRRNNKLKFIFLIAVAALASLVVIRVSLPTIVKIYINRSIEHSKNWTGHISGVDLSILSGSLKLKEGRLILSPEESVKILFAEAKVSLSLRGLLKKEVHLEGFLDGAFFDIKIRPPEKKASEKPLSAKVQEVKEKARANWPVFIDRFEIRNLNMELEDKTPLALPTFQLKDFNLLAENIWNRIEKQAGPSNINFTSETSGQGHLDGKLWFSAFSPSPKFRGQIEIKSLNLRIFNAMFRKNANFDLRKGWINIYMEFGTQDWQIDGYIKPILSGLNFIDFESKKSKPSFWRLVWQGILQLTADLLKNPQSKKVATKIPFSGRLDEPSTNPWSAFLTILENAFLDALQMGFDRKLKIEPRFPSAASR